jgi:hypothetical protein
MSRRGYLSQYFERVAAKRLRAVEVDTSVSHQHEFNGNKALKAIMGSGSGEKIEFPTVFIWLGNENEAVSAEGFVTWYDARRNHPSRSEYRLYFPTTEVSEMARTGDLMIVAKRTNGSVMIIICAAGSSLESQLLWLFGVPSQTEFDFMLSEIQQEGDRVVDFAVRFILDELGIEVEEPEADYYDDILKKFAGKLPGTKEFSGFTRSTLGTVSPLEDPDATLMAWMDHEEKLFRRIERYEIDTRLQAGFAGTGGTDVDGFLQFSLRIQNRRKSRAGHALENHLEEIFKVHNLAYERNAETENKVKPDFLFPGKKAYDDLQVPEKQLTMLGAKTTCKDRWRQVLSEAIRIPEKHLLTLEPGISENQTREMQASHLQLVLPRPLHQTYRPGQQAWLMDLNAFLKMVGQKQHIRNI